MSYCRITHQWLPASEMQKVYEDFDATEKILVSQEVETVTCDDCGEVFISDNVSLNLCYRNRDEQWVCDSCLDYYSRCDQCGEYYHEDNMTFDVDGKDLCEQCFEEQAVCCDHCGEYHLLAYSRHTEDDYWVCDACADNGYIYWCSECDTPWFYEDNLQYDDDGYCIGCNHCNEGSRTILNYGFKPTPKFHTNKAIQKEYFGFEIEVEGKKQYAEEFLEAFGDTEKDVIYLKNDGSVAGFEIVTHPMDRDYIYDYFKPMLEKGCKFLRENGFKGHNRAGIHIHVSTEAITSDMLKKLMVLLYPKSNKAYNIWLAITQRHDDKMQRWSSMKMGTDSKKRLMKEIDDREFHGEDKPTLDAVRYTAINVCRNTVEFRIFNSNIRPERILKNAEVIFSLLDFTKTEKMPTLRNYLKFIEENQGAYKFLFDFIVEKGIYQSIEQKEKQKQIIEAVETVTGKENLTVQDIEQILQNLNSTTTTEIDDNDERNELCA